MYSARLHHQSGIALGSILFILAALAILATAIAAGSGGFTANTATEGAKVNASTIIQIAEALQNAVRTVQANGSCDPTQISFSNPVITGINGSDVYANPNAPSDGSCNIFDPRGGNMSFPMATASTLETADAAHWIFEGSNSFIGLGNQKSGLSALAGFLPIDSLALCQNINSQVGMSGFLGWDWYVSPTDLAGHFIGTYYDNRNIMVDDGGTWKPGKIMGCLQQGSGGTSPFHNGTAYPNYAPYFFYVVLLIVRFLGAKPPALAGRVDFSPLFS